MIGFQVELESSLALTEALATDSLVPAPEMSLILCVSLFVSLGSRAIFDGWVELLGRAKATLSKSVGFWLICLGDGVTEGFDFFGGFGLKKDEIVLFFMVGMLMRMASGEM